MSVAALAAEGRATELAGIGKTLQDKVVALLETGDIPSAVKLRDRYPAGLIAVTQLPGLGPKRARLLHDELGIDSLEALRAAVESGRLGEVRGFGPKAQANILAALEARTGDRAPARMLLDRALAIAEPLVEALRAHPASQRVRAGRFGAPRRRHGQGPRRDSHRHRRASAGRGGGGAGRRRVGAVLRRGGRALDDPRGPAGGPADRGARPVRQPAPALHRLQAAQRGAATGGGAPRAARVRVRDPGRRRLEHHAVRHRGRGVRAPGLRVHRARAAREPRRAGGGHGGRAAPPDRGGRPAGRPALAHVRLRRAQLDRRDGGGCARAGLRVPGHHRPLGFDGLRQRRLSRPAQAPDPAGAGGERARRGHRAAGRQRGQCPARRRAGLRRRPPGRAGLGDRLRALVVSRRRGGDDRSHPQRGRAPATWTRSAT